MYTDAHTHLNSDRLYPDRQDHLIHFYQVGGRVLICIGTHDERNHRAIQISTDSSTLNLDSLVVKATVGIHPWEVCSWKIRSIEEIDNEISLLTKLLDSYPQQIVAIGECWIDAHYDGFDQTAELDLG
jgi:Tat protein secretion system quality control protein TatD with DNase activity